MSELKIHTNKDALGTGVISADGTKVTVGGSELKRVRSLKLEADPSGLWELVIRVAVDPSKLFVDDASTARRNTQETPE